MQEAIARSHAPDRERVIAGEPGAHALHLISAEMARNEPLGAPAPLLAAPQTQRIV